MGKVKRRVVSQPSRLISSTSHMRLKIRYPILVLLEYFHIHTAYYLPFTTMACPEPAFNGLEVMLAQHLPHHFL